MSFWILNEMPFGQTKLRSQLGSRYSECSFSWKTNSQHVTPDLTPGHTNCTTENFLCPLFSEPEATWVGPVMQDVNPLKHEGKVRKLSFPAGTFVQKLQTSACSESSWHIGIWHHPWLDLVLSHWPVWTGGYASYDHQEAIHAIWWSPIATPSLRMMANVVLQTTL